MDVKYQVFVSSTFVDLEAERRSVIETILNLKPIPIGKRSKAAMMSRIKLGKAVSVEGGWDEGIL